MTRATLRRYSPADHPWLVSQHQRLYAESEGFDDSFGPLVDDILSVFEAQHDPACEAGWIACQGAQRLGSIFCVRHTDTTAKLRLFLLVPEARGQGLGQTLLDHCMSFAKAAGYADMTLWTHASHTAACALYARNGWRLSASKPVRSFGVDLIEQQWDITLKSLRPTT
ncbi:MAG: GNAT family N-acetyltransferase [Pseudomonadota bacterium]